jgi:hypothetical protein
MPGLSHQRCFHHSSREAVARCPECSHFYCRECVTEHDDRVICAACLKKLAGTPFTQRSGFVGVLRVVQAGVGVLLVMIFFYTLGRSLLSMPSSFHDGTVWTSNFLEAE